jgi:hypothetical protein
MSNQEEIPMAEVVGEDGTDPEVGMTVLEAEPVEVVGTAMVPADSGQIAHLMEMAVQGGAESVGTLERLVELQHKVEDRNAEKSFVRALHAFQKEVGPIPKTKGIPSKEVNRDGTTKMRSHFAPLPAIADHIREPLAKNGFSYFWDSSIDGEMVDVRCTLQHEDGHSRTSSFTFREKDAAAPKMSGVQISGSARTYGERYSLIQVLGLTTVDTDDDGQDPAMKEKITDGQADFLKGLLKDGDANVQRFLAVYKIESVEEMTLKDFGRAVKDIEERNAAVEARKASREDS